MNMIFSADEIWGIGYQNNLLFRAKEDMRRFKRMTVGKVVVMGYNTLLSLPGGKPLPERVNMVLSRKPGLVVEGAVACADVAALFAEISRYPEEDVFVIGGEQVYRQLMPYCAKAYVTKFEATAPADRFMVNLDENENWKLIETSEPLEENGLRFTFDTYMQLDYSAILP
jgi:dihydrofolate reductase